MTQPRETASPAQRALWRLFGVLSFNRITVHDRPALPHGGAVLYLGLHRNGALDGVPYLRAAPSAAFLVSAQLHRFALGRFVFPGIAVARAKDKRRGIQADNDDGLARCVERLAQGGELFIMPEGTSSLGPRHLPFKAGAARIAQGVLARGVPLTVVPVAVHYECAWEWQSRVEVVCGTPLHFAAHDRSTEADLMERFSGALEAVGINVESAEELRLIERLAYGATLGTAFRYDRCLKHFESGVEPELRRDAAALETAAAGVPVLRHQGVPLIPIGSALPYLAAWLVLAPLMLAFAAANLPPLLAGAIAARKLPDDINVVAFWRAMIGVPVALLWGSVVTATLGLAYGTPATLGYVAVSAMGLRLVYRFRKLSVAVFNSLAAPQIKRPLLAFRETLLRSVPHA